MPAGGIVAARKCVPVRGRVLAVFREEVLVVEHVEAAPVVPWAAAFAFPSADGFGILMGENSSRSQLAFAGAVSAPPRLCEIGHFPEKVRNQIFKEGHCLCISLCADWSSGGAPYTAPAPAVLGGCFRGALTVPVSFRTSVSGIHEPATTARTCRAGLAPRPEVVGQSIHFICLLLALAMSPI
mgnify:CR=1 FL=1